MSIPKIISILNAKVNGGNGSDITVPTMASPAPWTEEGRRPQHQLISKDQQREASWGYPQERTEGYVGNDGGPVSDRTREVLRIDQPQSLTGVSVPVSNLAVGDEAARETVIGLDDRKPITWTNEYPWRMITALEIVTRDGRKAHGTGFMVSPTLVLTAGHCIYDAQMGGWAETITVRPGFGKRDGEPVEPFGAFAISQGSKMRVDQAWVNDADPRFDFGFLELPEPVGNQTGWFALGTDDNDRLAARVINVCGYSADRDPSQQWHCGGTIKYLEPLRLYHDGDTYGGNSGGPVWIAGEDGSHVVTAIHAYGTGAASPHASGPLNSGTRIVPYIKQSADHPTASTST